MTEDIKRILERVETLPAVSPHTLRIMQLAADPQFNIKDLTALVVMDMSLAATCLKLVNSTIFGLRNPVTSIEKAVVYLGSRGILDLAASMGMNGIMRSSLEGYEGESGDLWLHSLRTAIASTLVAGAIYPHDPAESVYTAGLVHDIGKVVLSVFLSEHDSVLREFLQGEPSTDFVSLEKKLLFMDHTEAGDLLADKWKLPPSIRMAIRWHHTPSLAPEPFRNLCLAVHIGDIMAMLGGSGTGCDTLVYRIDPLAQEVFRSQGDRMTKLLLDIDTEFTRAQEKLRAVSGEEKND